MYACAVNITFVIRFSPFVHLLMTKEGVKSINSIKCLFLYSYD